MMPISIEISADLLTPVSAYLKISREAQYAFLFESVEGGVNVGRYSFLGSNPSKVIQAGVDFTGDPVEALDQLLTEIEYVKPPGGCEGFLGGAVGYLSFECIHHFEPKTLRTDLEDILEVPEAVFMVFDIVVAFDHLHKTVKAIGNLRYDRKMLEKLPNDYEKLLSRLAKVVKMLESSEVILPEQPQITKHYEAKSNVGQAGYEQYVKTLKNYIVDGDIIQAVPSQRLVRQTDLHPFNIYRQLRSVNPSPYMFYLNMKTFQIIGASPEMLCQVESDVVSTHPIAGTRRRGAGVSEDKLLEQELLNDVKERAEHVMLVDLGRNDINRVCAQAKVDSLMQVERYRHVMHLVSRVSGQLRAECSPFDAFRSIFPAGTVSGAPKIRAIQLIADCEKERRGVYAGAVGYFGYDKSIDTAIAIRTVVYKDGKVYLQAGGGITYDSDPSAEYIETINKLQSVVAAIDQAEQKFMAQLFEA